MANRRNITRIMISSLIQLTILNSLVQTGGIGVRAQQLESTRRMIGLPSQWQTETQARTHKSAPGHYEFEVAPAMEPPSVKKPPYTQTSQICSGSDLFGGFSPKDTLCGDLNTGMVPLNPLGQLVTEQSYPFELIKNKTLQFLARALPVLKLEYETIPKVARYLPANHLLNPTSNQSPLASEHFHHLNQRFKGAELLASDEYAQLMAAAALEQQHQPQHQQQGGSTEANRRRRKRRSLGGSGSDGGLARQQQTVSGLTIAELSPNATLVVSSAHSSAGRIQQPTGGAHPQAMITKDGYKSIVQSQQQVPAVRQTSSGQSHQQQSLRSQQLVVLPEETRAKSSSNKQATVSPTGERLNNHASTQQQQQQNQYQLNAATSGTSGMATANRQENFGGQRISVAHASNSQPESRATNEANEQNDNNNNNRNTHNRNNYHQQQQQSQSQSNQLFTRSNTNHEVSGGSQTPDSASKQHESYGPTNANSLSQRRRQLPCGELGGVFASTVCQTVSALIDGEKAPAWLQIAKHIGNIYSSSDQFANSMASTSTNPIWSVWNALSGAGSGGASGQELENSGKSSGGASMATTASTKSSSTGSSLFGLFVAPIANLLLPASYQHLFGPSPPIQHAATNRASQAPLAAAADRDSAGAGSSNGDSNPVQMQPKQDTTAATSSSSSINYNNYNPNHHSQQPMSLFGNISNASLLTKMALAGLATTKLASLFEHFIPSLFYSTSRTFAKRKKLHDSRETFVDTPASLAAERAAGNGNGGGGGVGAQPLGRQPPTPCPSVEEYISPTFARNYQGAWKYVVQIPHEGYFTQTIQRSSCLRQKCEFTDGVCHEAPRWVSLLVAEIYYPNALFGAQQPQHPINQPNQLTGEQLQLVGINRPIDNANGLQQQQQMAASTSNIQQLAMGQQQPQHNHHQQAGQSRAIAQDPLQMTDSLTSPYNQNINTAFYNAANELGLDPSNMAQMQQLANAHNYQLLSRNGLIQSSSGANSNLGQTMVAATNQNYPQIQQQPTTASIQQMASQQPTQQETATAGGQQQPPYGSSDYIRALAMETLRQNPHLSIDDLIKSFQMQQSRKKRDLKDNVTGANQLQQHQQQQVFSAPSHHQSTIYERQQLQPRSSSSAVETMPSLNDIGSSVQGAMQQQIAGSVPTFKAGQAGAGPNSINNGDNNNNIQPIAVVTQMDQHVNGPPINTNDQQQQQQSAESSVQSQIECDGHDKIGCYVVRVYYDWFLVNGSCKCWRTTTNSAGNHQQQSSTGSAGSANSFLRRIFTG